MAFAETTLPAPRAAYIHVPFCRRRCGYCNFTLVAGRDDLIAAYLKALEIELAALHRPHEVDTLFFGGGTPSHLPPDSLARLLEIVRRWHPLATGGEWSIEANPADITPQRIAVLTAAGVNRVSLGVQSFSDRKLIALERDHTSQCIARAVELLRPCFSSISLDLIFASPGETLAEWEADLTAALELRPQHISTYGLTYERGAAFWGRLQRGELQLANEEIEAAMYETAISRLCAAGYEHYEVSNFAMPGQRCRHNETYWTGGGYFAAGPGAARLTGGVRAMNHRSTTSWIKRLLSGGSPVAETEKLPPFEAARERLVIALRRLEGVRLEDFAQSTGFTAEQCGGAALKTALRHQLLTSSDGWLRLTRAGLLISDTIWSQMLAQADSHSPDR